ncbi:hypothetical protein K2173_009884 [Erythroxylum novogranatense]|uniref:Retrotransposon Copia-like N-terminal domain-containing protein n=1 Tax=Erythroxylum novogranatense TaxID=1862640 RepID=A0AAV8T0F6_9ROSI|nr:hypothetical protein K2173_009884 [Erythroxylum novogranatense]
MATVDPSFSSSPYFLHPNENPSLVLVSSVLTSLNFNSWSRAMQMALLSKNKLKFVDDSILPPPVADSLFPAWECCNNMVISWLHRSISPSIVNSVLWIDYAFEVWRDLHERFSQGDVFRISDLQDEISVFKQEERTVTDYFTELKELWDELLNFRPLPSCSCRVQCSCSAFDTIRRYHSNDYVIRFLKGLNDKFSTVHSQIMLMEPLPSINKAFSLVIQQERQLLADSSSTFAGNAIRSYQSKSSSSQSRSSDSKVDTRQCSFCGQPRHTVDTCYHKHGFPPGYKSRRQTSRANNVFEDIEVNTIIDSVQVGSSHNSAITLTQQQIAQLLALLPSTSTSPSNSSPRVTN